jgi:hypothetical protein
MWLLKQKSQILAVLCQNPLVIYKIESKQIISRLLPLAKFICVGTEYDIRSFLWGLRFHLYSFNDYDKLCSCVVCVCFDTSNNYIYIDYYYYYFINCISLF